MRSSMEPQLSPVALTDLRPTQMTVGLIEVERKRHGWRARLASDGPEFLGTHMIPVVIGPKQVPWMIDNHHLARALFDEGVKHVLVSVVARLDRLDRTAFLTFMDNRNWLHPFDAKGVRQHYDDIPRKLSKMADDPYRSIAGAVRRAGGYAKDLTPYSEFLWADFFRHRIDAKLIGKDIDKAVTKALALAHAPQANHLPGWCGSS
ncbi:chromosome partitioning protein ParB (plasmid) [Sphingomonas paeninsulae]|jgi:hypothetical protein|uniref:Chromosome partitioning protein ParB n=1 Tax=Sphingomonas paeninsulae TaxID=2319844 RepID=A0A494TCB8_SPHPE|nr:ParB-like protein [Sphingomonas paeninsulae]AYJ85022.1 chromosome partitioning protein ParB [Sphingomonas paeninsulae]